MFSGDMRKLRTTKDGKIDVTYRLNPLELDVARLVAAHRRRYNSGQTNLPHETMTPEQLFENDFVAACGEIVVSRVMNLCWTGCGYGPKDKPNADIGDMFEVRTVRSLQKGLLVRTDSKDLPYILVYIDPSGLGIVKGWAWKSEVQDRGVERGQENPETRYWTLEMKELNPIEEII